jgi:hypothetical protein
MGKVDITAYDTAVEVKGSAPINVGKVNITDECGITNSDDTTLGGIVVYEIPKHAAWTCAGSVFLN